MESFSSNTISGSYNGKYNYERDLILSQGIEILYTFMNLLSDLANTKYLEMRKRADFSRDSQEMANQVEGVIADVAKEDDKAKRAIPDNVVKYMRDNHITVNDKSIDDYLKSKLPTTMTEDTKLLNKLQEKIAQSGPEGIPLKSVQDIVNYMDKHNIKVNEKSCSNYIAEVTDLNNHLKKTLNIDETTMGKIASFTLEANSMFNPLKQSAELIHSLVKKKISHEHIHNIENALSARMGLNKGQLEAVKAAIKTVSDRASDFVSQSQLQIQKVMQTYNITVNLLNSMQTMLGEMNKSIAQNIR
ncbi:secretion protein EspA [Candidatus Arsenophonus triatominarum]|uniref:secretion protein EspA n=1 Tax=Candidatus Arsenophonus triatominarum TaxID=57911 RepID=UPI00164FAF53|nr:secretion protein EspA [Candidatus Arsenophonus triatominarum]